MTSTTTRFLNPALMLGLSLLATLLTKMPKAIFAITIVVLTALGVWGTSHFVSLHSQVFSSEKVALGQESGEECAKRTIDHFETATFANEHLPSDAKLLFIGESRPFYFNKASLAPYPYHEHPLGQWIREAASTEELREKLRKEGFTISPSTQGNLNACMTNTNCSHSTDQMPPFMTSGSKNYRIL
ncbi:MAG: hypothetical protein AAB433_05070 [Nitrospirota bacterium]|mgnify:FL=1